MEELLPGLPDDVGMLCLGRVSYHGHASMQGVCRRWNEIINNPLFYEYRCKQGFATRGLCIVQAIPSAEKNGTVPPFRLCMLDTKTGAWLWLPPIPGFPESVPLFCECAYVNGDLFLMGGWNPKTYDTISSVYAFNFSSGCWRKAADMITARSFFACGVLQGCIVVAGGHDPDKNALSSAEIYYPALNQWQPLPNMSQERDEAKGIVLNGKFYVLGGYPTQFQGGFTKSADMFDPTQGIWVNMEEIWIEGAVPSTTFAWNGRLFALRGNSLVVFDEMKRIWSVVDTIPNGGEGMCVNVVGDEIVVMARLGGECRTFMYKESMEKGKNGHWKLVEQERKFKGVPEFACSVEI